MAKKIGAFILIFFMAYAGGRAWMYWQDLRARSAPLSARLIECDPNDVRGIRILQKDGKTLEFHRNDAPRPGVPTAALLAASQWQIQSNPVEEAEASILSRLSSIACDLYNPTSAEGETFAASAGNAVTLELVLQREGNSSSHAIDFGPYTADRQSLVRYRGPSGGRLLHVTPKLLQLASLPAEEFKNLKVLRQGADQAMKATLFEGQKERFSLERNGAGWSIHAGGKLVGAGGEKASQYVNRLGTLRALSAKPAGGTKCEASPYKIRIALEGIGGRAEDLYLDYGKAGNIRACDSARDTIFEVHRDLLKYVDVPAKALAR